MTKFFLIFFVACLIGNYMGKITAHHTIKNECNKLNMFYMGTTVYDCKPRKDKKSNEKKPLRQSNQPYRFVS